MLDCNRLINSTNFFWFCEGCCGFAATGVVVVGVLFVDAAEGLAAAVADGSVDVGLAVVPSGFV